MICQEALIRVEIFPHHYLINLPKCGIAIKGHEGNRWWSTGRRLVVCHPNTFGHSVMAVVLGSWPRLRIRLQTRKFAFAKLSTLSTFKIMPRQPQHSPGRDVRSRDILGRTPHIHPRVSSSDLSLGTLPESFMWDWKRRSTGKGVRPSIPKTKALTTSPSLLGKYWENIPGLHMILTEVWGKGHLLSANFQVYIMHSLNF